MKKISIGLLALSGVVFLNSCTATKTAEAPAAETVAPAQPASVKEEGLNLSYMDTTVRPQDDFFSYVNGNWVKTAEIPSDKASWGSFNALREDVDVASLGILNQILNDNFPPGSEGQKIQALYGTFMDWDKRNADGINPIKNDLARIEIGRATCRERRAIV